MVRVDQIRSAMHAQPFRPFRLKLVDGTEYTIKHPDFIAVPPGPRPRDIVWYGPERGEDYETHWIDLGLILEVIVPSGEEAGTPQTDGPGPS